MDFTPARISYRIISCLIFVGTALSLPPSYTVSHNYANLQLSAPSSSSPIASASLPPSSSSLGLKSVAYSWPTGGFGARYNVTPSSEALFANVVAAASPISIIPLNGTQSTSTQASSSTATWATPGPNPDCPAAQWERSPAALYDSAQTGQWLDSWWNARNASFNSNQGGFVEDFWADWVPLSGQPTCKDAEDDCTFNLCDINTTQAMQNNQDLISQPSVQQVYNVLESVTNLHDYFKLLSDSVVDAAAFAGLAKDNWAYTFYIDKNSFNAVFLKELLNALAVVISIVAVVISGPEAIGIAAAAASVAVAGRAGLASNTLGSGILGGTVYGMKLS